MKVNPGMSRTLLKLTSYNHHRRLNNRFNNATGNYFGVCNLGRPDLDFIFMIDEHE